MKTQEELRLEYDRLFEAEEYEAARKLLDALEPATAQQWRAALAAAPLDDEPVTASDRRRLDEVHASLSRIRDQRAG